jgi:hypothetical protein
VRFTPDPSLKVTECLSRFSKLEWGRPDVGEGLQTLAQNGRQGLIVIKKIDAPLRVKTLSFGEAAGFIPQERT